LLVLLFFKILYFYFGNLYFKFGSEAGASAFLGIYISELDNSVGHSHQSVVREAIPTNQQLGRSFPPISSQVGHAQQSAARYSHILAVRKAIRTNVDHSQQSAAKQAIPSIGSWLGEDRSHQSGIGCAILTNPQSE
jgi:hypothetical protein